MRWIRRATRAAAVAAVLLAMHPAESAALGEMKGHLALGFAQLFVADAPGGSLSVAGGLDVPVGAGFRLGGVAGYHLLGSRTVERGSLSANIDYSVFEAAVLLHWLPPRLGPIERVSAGPGLFRASAELSTSGGGAAFSDLAVGEIVPGLAFEATLMRRAPAPVRVGLELATRLGLVEAETWALASARLVFHY